MNTHDILRYQDVQTLGFYVPSSFYIHHIGNGRWSDWQNWNDSDLATLFHEYVHYLQDLTTVQGLQNMYVFCEYIKGVSSVVQKSDSKIIKKPILPMSLKMNIDNNIIIHNLGLGSINNKVQSISNYNKKQSGWFVDSQTLSQEKGYPIEIVELECQQDDGKNVNIQFGSLALMESMAKLMEIMMFPQVEDKSPRCPYHTAEDVAELIYPGFSSNKLVLIALCEYALQSSSPGATFVRFIENKKNLNIPLDKITVKSIYSELMQGITFSSLPNSSTAFASNYVERAKLALYSLKSYDTTHLWRHISQYYDVVIANGANLRIQNTCVLTNMVELGDLRHNAIFKDLLTKFGTPLISNVNYELDFLPPQGTIVDEEDLKNIYAYHEIYKAFAIDYTEDNFTKDKASYCQLYELCHKNGIALQGNLVDERCIKSPWERVKEIPRCYYARWWYFWAFKDVKFVK